MKSGAERETTRQTKSRRIPSRIARSVHARREVVRRAQKRQSVQVNEMQRAHECTTLYILRNTYSIHSTHTHKWCTDQERRQMEGCFTTLHWHFCYYYFFAFSLSLSPHLSRPSNYLFDFSSDFIHSFIQHATKSEGEKEYCFLSALKLYILIHIVSTYFYQLYFE